MSESRIEGLDAWLNFVEEIPQKLEEKVRDHVSETALKLTATAKLLCPVDTERLRKSIAPTFPTAYKGMRTEVGTNVEYSETVEFGNSRQQAQPYMFPAFAQWKPKFIDGMKDIVKRVGD